MKNLILVNNRKMCGETNIILINLEAIFLATQKAEQYVADNGNVSLGIEPFKMANIYKELLGEGEDIKTLDGDTYVVFSYEYDSNYAIFFETVAAVFSDKEKALEAKKTLNVAFEEDDEFSFEIEKFDNGVRTGITVNVNTIQ